MTLSITDLKKGTIFKFNDVPYKVVDYNQKVMGRGGSIVNVRIKSLTDGSVLEKTFKGNEQLDQADVARNKVNYLYSDSGSMHFMDNDTYEQFELSLTELETESKYLKEGDQVQILIYNSQPISLELPNSVPLKVTYTENVVKGDTATNILKDATLETGLNIKVPPFIKEGDVIKVDTRTGAYIERQK